MTADILKQAAAWIPGMAAGCILASRQLFHFFQLESYQFPGFFRTVRRQGIRACVPGIVMCVTTFGGALFLNLILHDFVSYPFFTALALWNILCGEAVRRLLVRQPSKKKMSFTPRMKRLHIVSFLTYAAVFFLFQRIALILLQTGNPPFALLCTSLFPCFLPLTAALSGLLAWPVEKGISEAYFRDAQRILREHPDLIRIGITGSWGKTSVKFILGAMLSEKFPVLVTPSSFNTPMGVTKVIRTQLMPGHRIFIAEMGARHVGDIKEMCRLVHPGLGILTSVGPQHLDTFKTQDRITKTKYELIEAIPDSGSCFFADDDGIVLSLWDRTKKDKHLAGLNSERDDTWAESLSVSPSGSQFLLCHGNERILCETSLLGELNIRNITLCAEVCFFLGMSGKEIARGIRKLRPVEHRLEIRHISGNVTVLDDAFNSNIRGARQAFQVIKAFPGKRIVVTPGMVELGDREEELNREFGTMMADCCDIAILVGKKRSAAIISGLVENGFDRKNIRVAASLTEAESMLKDITRAGDTILFENDLPDNYSEE